MRKKNSMPEIAGAEPDTGAKPAYGGEGHAFDKLLIIRLVLASILFAAALAGRMSELLSTLFLIMAAAAAGYDLVISAITDVSVGKYFEAPLIVVFTAVISFAIGFGSEGAALIILFRIGLLLIDYAKARTVTSALEFIPEEQEDITERVARLFSDPDTGRTELEERLAGFMGIFSKVLLAAAVIYAIALPLISDFSYTVSIHRAITLMIVATSISVLSSLRLCDVVGIGFCAASGVVYSDSGAFDKTRTISAAVFDKSGVFSDGRPRVSAVKSSLLRPDMFIKIAAHIAHYSKNVFEKAVAEEYDGKVMTEAIDSHVEIPGCGSEILIKGIPMCFGTKDMMSLKGIRVPEEDIRIEWSALYMSIAGRYVGCVTLSEEINPEAEAIVSDYRAAGIDKCSMITGDGEEVSAAFAASVGVSEYFARCEGDEKLSAVEKCRVNSEDGGALLFVYSQSGGRHSAADIDASTGAFDPNSDIFLAKGGIRELPFAMSISRRASVIFRENAAFAIAVKLLIIALTLTGFCNLWFAVFLDMAAALGAILNTIRVSMPPIFIFVKKSRD